MVKKSKGRLLLGASYSGIEPYGIMTLGGLARDLGWDRSYSLVKDHNFESFFEHVKDYKPDFVGFNVYTGNHVQLAEAFTRLKKDSPAVKTIVGGPHPTYFPSESAAFADYVVMSEGFRGLTAILNGTAKPGIISPGKISDFPKPDRERFYEYSPEHAESLIKSMITMTGCPYTCTYCYNSSQPGDVKDNMPPEIAEQMALALGMSGRLFPKNIRNVEDVIQEGKEIAERWPAKMIYMQDDVHGFDIKKWMPEFAERWPVEVQTPYHAQMRFEMTKQDERLDLIKKAGGTGLFMAIEAADPFVRKEVLHRDMAQELMFEGLQKLADRGLTVRTGQITALPYGATSQPTKMNLEADLEITELNVDLKRETSLPSIAWSSTLAPYNGTKLAIYCAENGHYSSPDNNDVPDTFFEKSVLRFPKEWIGPSLKDRKEDPGVWLSRDDLEEYRVQNAELRRIFNIVTLVPEGHKLARSYLTSSEPFSYERLGKETEEHLTILSRSNPEAQQMLDNISETRTTIERESTPEEFDQINPLAPYLAVLPMPQIAVRKVIKYTRERGKGELTGMVLSDAVKHHLYNNVVYMVGEKDEEPKESEPIKI